MHFLSIWGMGWGTGWKWTGRKEQDLKVCYKIPSGAILTWLTYSGQRWWLRNLRSYKMGELWTDFHSRKLLEYEPLCSNAAFQFLLWHFLSHKAKCFVKEHSLCQSDHCPCGISSVSIWWRLILIGTILNPLRAVSGHSPYRIMRCSGYHLVHTRQVST